jgi:hypothetical protein
VPTGHEKGIPTKPPSSAASRRRSNQHHAAIGDARAAEVPARSIHSAAQISHLLSMAFHSSRDNSKVLRLRARSPVVWASPRDFFGASAGSLRSISDFRSCGTKIQGWTDHAPSIAQSRASASLISVQRARQASSRFNSAPNVFEYEISHRCTVGVGGCKRQLAKSHH